MSTNSTDPSLPARQLLSTVLNSEPRNRTALEAAYGQVWDADEFRHDFYVLGHRRPLVCVIRKRDGKLGTLLVQHKPRFYFEWKQGSRFSVSRG